MITPYDPVGRKYFPLARELATLYYPGRKVVTPVQPVTNEIPTDKDNHRTPRDMSRLMDIIV